jgi:hypothetical protein
MKETLILITLPIADIILGGSNQPVTNTVIGSGIGIGSALAVSICWTETKSVLKSAIAGLFGWFFVIYYLIIRER